MVLRTWSIATRVAQSTFVAAILSSCTPRHIATDHLERSGCANVPGIVRLHFAARRMPELERQGLGALLVEVRSRSGPPIEGVLVLFGANPPDLAVDTSDASGRATLQFPPRTLILQVRRVGYTAERIPFTFRAGYTDTVRVRLQCAVPTYN